MTQSPYFLALLALMAGIGIPVMASLNAGLGQKLSSAHAATFILFLVGAVISGAAMVFSGNMPKQSLGSGNPVYYMAGIFVVFYILSITWIIPKFGVGNAIFFVLLGQIISAAMIDHFGWFGAQVTPLGLQRAFGILLMGVGVFICRPIS